MRRYSSVALSVRARCKKFHATLSRFLIFRKADHAHSSITSHSTRILIVMSQSKLILQPIIFRNITILIRYLILISNIRVVGATRLLRFACAHTDPLSIPFSFTTTIIILAIRPQYFLFCLGYQVESNFLL